MSSLLPPTPAQYNGHGVLHLLIHHLLRLLNIHNGLSLSAALVFGASIRDSAYSVRGRFGNRLFLAKTFPRTKKVA